MLIQPKDLFVTEKVIELDGYEDPVKFYALTPQHFMLLEELKHPFVTDGVENTLFHNTELLVVLSCSPCEVFDYVKRGCIKELQSKVKEVSLGFGFITSDLLNELAPLCQINDSIRVKKKATVA